MRSPKPSSKQPDFHYSMKEAPEWVLFLFHDTQTNYKEESLNILLAEIISLSKQFDFRQ